MGWIITVLILFLLAILPLGISIAYNEDGPLVRVVAGPVKLKVYPGKKRDPNKPKKKKEKATAEKKPAKQGTSGKKGGPISDFYPFVTLVLELLLDFRRKLRLDYVRLRITLVGGDPAELAVNYGKTWTAVGNLWPRLETWFVIKKRDVEVLCDFEGSGNTVDARLDLSITLGRLLVLAVRYGVRGLREFLNFRNKRNGGSAV